jgi:hypothetical protein
LAPKSSFCNLFQVCTSKHLEIQHLQWNLFLT